MKRWLRRAFQLASLLLFAVLVWYAGPESWQQILSGDPRSVLAAFLLTGLAQMLAAERLRSIGRAIVAGPLAPWRAVYHVAMMAQLLGLVLPRGVSTIGGKTVGLRTLGVSVRRSVLMVLLDNLFDVVFLSLLGVPGLLFALGQLSLTGFLAAATVLTGLIGAGLVWLTGDGRQSLPLDWLQHWPRWGNRLYEQAQLLLDRLPDRLTAMRALALTVAVSVALALRFYFVGRAIGLDAGWPLFAALFPVTQLSLIIALAPGGLGIFDLSWVGLLHLAGIGESEALAFAIAQRAYVTLFILVWSGFSALLSLTGRRQSEEPLPRH